MKKVLPIIFMLISFVVFTQNRYSKVTTSSFKPLSYSEMSRVATTLQKRYNQNQKYLYDMKKWILELKPQIKEQKFINRLNGEYSVLTSMEDDDLARATKILKQRENSIREVISEYNTWINTQNNNKTRTTQSTQSTPSTQSTQSTQSSNEQNNIEVNYAQKGYKLQKNKEFANAIFNYSKHLENNENNTDVLFLRAMCKSELNDRYGAINDYDRIIALEKTAKPTIYKMSTVYNNKAFCLVNLRNYKDALPLVNKALKMDKTEAYIWDTRGELYYHLGEYEKSIEDMKNAIKIEKYANSYLYRGLSNLKLEKKYKACSDFSKAGELGESRAYKLITENCN
jgi:tetratricopeptide (TPR) repeat protein